MIETSITVPIKGMFTADWNLHNSTNKGKLMENNSLLMIETSITVPIKGMFTADWNLHNSTNKGNVYCWLKPP